MSEDDDGMCPNCVTPWKCNGPHLGLDARCSSVMGGVRLCDVPAMFLVCWPGQTSRMCLAHAEHAKRLSVHMGFSLTCVLLYPREQGQEGGS